MKHNMGIFDPRLSTGEIQMSLHWKMSLPQKIFPALMMRKTPHVILMRLSMENINFDCFARSRKKGFATMRASTKMETNSSSTILCLMR